MPKDFSDLLTLFGVNCRATNVNKIKYPSKGSEYWFYFNIAPAHAYIQIKSKKRHHSDDTRIFYKMQLKIETFKMFNATWQRSYCKWSASVWRRGQFLKIDFVVNFQGVQRWSFQSFYIFNSLMNHYSMKVNLFTQVLRRRLFTKFRNNQVISCYMAENLVVDSKVGRF